jgi:hypothetical protein
MGIGRLIGRIIVFRLINGHCIQRISFPTRRPFIPSPSYNPASPFPQIVYLDDIFPPSRPLYQYIMMPASIEVGQRNLHTPRSPVSISTDSSRRGSLKQVLPEKHTEQQTPISPQTRLTRKRAASLNPDTANDPRIGDLALNSASTNGPPTSDPTREQVCLCQPDPKIPRPRNGKQSIAPFSFLVSRCDWYSTIPAPPLSFITCPKNLD